MDPLEEKRTGWHVSDLNYPNESAEYREAQNRLRRSLRIELDERRLW
jgi:hypothetical protein